MPVTRVLIALDNGQRNSRSPVGVRPIAELHPIRNIQYDHELTPALELTPSTKVHVPAGPMMPSTGVQRRFVKGRVRMATPEIAREVDAALAKVSRLEKALEQAKRDSVAVVERLWPDAPRLDEAALDRVLVAWDRSFLRTNKARLVRNAAERCARKGCGHPKPEHHGTYYGHDPRKRLGERPCQIKVAGADPKVKALCACVEYKPSAKAKKYIALDRAEAAARQAQWAEENRQRQAEWEARQAAAAAAKEAELAAAAAKEAEILAASQANDPVAAAQRVTTKRAARKAAAQVAI